MGLGLILSGCNENNVVEPITHNFSVSNNPGGFGVNTSIVVYVNPTINQGSTGNIIMGTQKEGVAVKLENQSPVYTNTNGVAVLTNVPVQNNLAVYIENNLIYVNVLGQLDQYDVIVSYRNDSVQLVTTPLRYRYTENIRLVNNFVSFRDLLKENNITIFLEPGVYHGNLEISGNNISIIGAWAPGTGLLSTIDGNVTVYGNNICIYDLSITGDLIVKGNNFEISYSQFNRIDIEREEVVIIKNNVVSGVANVSVENNVFLFDNINLP